MTTSQDFIIRTEDLRPEDTLKLYVSTTRDDQLVALLKSNTPLILEGSRGTGKSFLLRVCEQTQLAEFSDQRVLPIYISFAKSSLLSAACQEQFIHWMMSRVCSQILRAIRKNGLTVQSSNLLGVLAGSQSETGTDGRPTRLEKLSDEFEASFKSPKAPIDHEGVPTVEEFRDTIEDLCELLNIKRFDLLFDEAAHIFKPEQQRHFFTLFRDLRSPYMTCNAAVYPGVTAYGSVFETTHDASIEQLNRNIFGPKYLQQMREIVAKQASSTQQRQIEKNGENFDALAYAVTGNPRLLLKTVALARLSPNRCREVDVART